ncbi:MAG: hypothetical protein AAFQ59_17120 [Pseudomonadota bacterium]
MSEPSAKSTASVVRAHATDLADQAADTVSATARAKAEEVRDGAAAEVQKTADAAAASMDTLDAGSVQAQVVEQLAGTLEQLAGQIRTTDIDRTARAVTDFASRNPALFVGGAALAGFAATRFFKARGRSEQTYLGHDDDPWNDGAARGQYHDV